MEAAAVDLAQDLQDPARARLAPVQDRQDRGAVDRVAPVPINTVPEAFLARVLAAITLPKATSGKHLKPTPCYYLS